jgi:hypothetical protein
MERMHKTALRAAVLIRGQLAAPRLPGATLPLPQYAWNAAQQLQRQIERAQQRGWLRAAARLTEDLSSTLDDCRRGLERALGDIQSQPDPSPVPPAADIYRELLALQDEFEETAIDLEQHEVCVTTGPISLEDVYLGRFEVRLDWRRLGCGQP